MDDRRLDCSGGSVISKIEPARSARDAYGQFLYVDPGRELVIARFGTAEDSPSTLLDPLPIPMIYGITRVPGA